MGITGDSRINVEITGDSSDLRRELQSGEKGIGKFAGSAKAAMGAAAVVGLTAGVVAFGDEALEQGDRLGDATARLQEQIGDLSADLIDTADQFAGLGLSAQDILELEAKAADVMTALGVSDSGIAQFADDIAATAGAIALLTDLEAPDVVDLIGKAADGSEKAMKLLGIHIDDAEIAARALADTGKPTADALTDGELAAAGYEIVLERLKPRLDEVAAGQGDVEQSAAELEAKWETLMGKIGEGIDGPLNDFLGWTIAGVEGWEAFAASMAAPEERLKAIAALLLSIAQLLPGVGGAFEIGTNVITSGGSGKGSSSATKGGDTNVTLNVVPRDSADTERAVTNAVRDYERRSGRETY